MTTADEDRLALRRAKAVELRAKGKTIREIAEELDIGVATAHLDVRTAMTEYAQEAEENVREQRGTELYRLDRALRVVEDVLRGALDEAGDDGLEPGFELRLKALDRLVKIQDQRAKLLGLYAPEKMEAKVAAVGLEDLDALRKTAEANECSPEANSSKEPNS